MDKLRALQYFVAAAEEHSFSGAARRFAVSVPAVAKLVASLEASLGARLFDRATQGLTITMDGLNYLETCRPLLEQLAAADEKVGGAASSPRGTVVIGAPPFISQHCILPALPLFHARYPEIEIDIRIVSRLTDAEAGNVDVFVLLGWPEHPDLVYRRLGQTRLLICAAPSYWAAHGVPTCPNDLARHGCLLFRGPEGAVLDLWEFERGEEKSAVTVSGWLTSSHRDLILDAAIAGEGVARLSDLSIRTQVHGGSLAPVLLDWEVKYAPPVNLLYRAKHRRSPRVRLFIEFITELFRNLEAERHDGGKARLAAERPPWYRRRYERASSIWREKA